MQENLSKSDKSKLEYGAFNKIVDDVLNDHAPLKKKTVRVNDSLFMTKSLRKAIMTRTRLRNRYNKVRNDENWKAFKKQRNKCVKLLPKAKNDCYGNLNLKLLTDNIKFWRTVKPLFSDRIQTYTAITLLENNELVNDNRIAANIFNDYFVSITESLDIPTVSKNLTPINEISDPLDIASTKYKSHPSVKLIIKRVQVEHIFKFEQVSLQEVVVKLQKLMRLIEKCREFLDKNGHAGALLMDLSKAFDCIDHDLLIAKLHAYGFSRSILELIYSYLNERKQRVKVNRSFSARKESTKGVPQGSVLRPLLFNTSINDIFFLVSDTEVCNYADNTTIFECDSDLNNVQCKLEADASLLSKWFVDNHMKLNDAKCHFMLFGSRSAGTSVNIGKSCIEQSDKEKLLGITLDKNLDFKGHVEN